MVEQKQWLMAVVALLGVLIPGAGLACIEQPMTTWDLVREADLIVLGRVVRAWRLDSIPEDVVPPSETEEQRQTREMYQFLTLRDRVEFEVREVWKGASAKSLTVISDRNRDDLSDTKPGNAAEGTWQLLVLNQVDGGWRVTGLWSDRRIEEGEVPAWRERVKEALQSPVHEKARRDWNVLGILHPATRWDALSDLLEDLRPWSKDADVPLVAPAAPLVDAVARRRIASSFISRPDRAEHLSEMLLLLAGHADPEVDRIASTLMEKRLAAGVRVFPLSFTQDALDLLSVRLGADGPGTERCAMGGLEDEEAATILPCVRARWERIRALHAQQRH